MDHADLSPQRGRTILQHQPSVGYSTSTFNFLALALADPCVSWPGRLALRTGPAESGRARCRERYGSACRTFWEGSLLLAYNASLVDGSAPVLHLCQPFLHENRLGSGGFAHPQEHAGIEESLLLGSGVQVSLTKASLVECLVVSAPGL